ncbi:MAG TPA: prolyl oligopeptidase family serine peptidase [Gemmatimonadales bacterium]
MRRFLVLTTILAAYAPRSAAQEPYKTPPDVVRAVLDAPSLPGIEPSPDGSKLLLMQIEERPSIAQLAQPMLRLAGLRLNPRTNDRFTTRGINALAVRSVAGGAEVTIATPAGVRVTDVRWSPDGKLIAYISESDGGLTLWVADPGTGAARDLTGPSLNGTLGNPCQWMPGSDRLLCAFVPEGRGAPPVEARVPTGPIVQHSEGRAAPVRTYQDLLASPDDEALFDYYVTAQLATVDAVTGARAAVGAPGIFTDVDPSPSGALVLISRVERPYSRLVPIFRFPQEIELWNIDGRRVAALASVPLGDAIPIGGVQTGPRSFSWRSDQPATLTYVEAVDGGETMKPAEYRDRVVSLAAPFTVPVELGKLNYRYAGISWAEGGVALLSELDRRTRHLRTWKIDANDASIGWRIVFDRSTEDRYADPGRPLFTRNAAGRSVLKVYDRKWIFLAGAGASPEGDRPFLDRLNLDNRKTERLWESAEDAYETVSDVLDGRGRLVIVRSEQRTAPPNYHVRDLRTRASTLLTHFANPVPELANLRRELLTYERADGVQLSGTLYYPTNYREGQRVPVVFWIYPREFVSADVAGQVQGSQHRFVLPSGPSHLFLLTQGYAVLDNPTLPVVGGDAANDTYQEQTVAGAQAAIDHLMEMGIADGNFGVGGHSYGAFATANLLAHSDLFKAGVARSGAYNRTLTPFGFQNEQRTFWEAPELYLRMMPFTHADKINEPILLIHGMNDNNSGTFPIQSERMYHALKGNGATVEYVQLPYESHGYAARESVMDVIARMIEWFDRYVKGAVSTSEDRP